MQEGNAHGFQITQILPIRRPSQLSRNQSLHHELHAEDIHACIVQRADGREIRPSIVLPQGAGDIVLAELCAGFV